MDTTMCKIESWWEAAVYSTGSSARCCVMLSRAGRAVVAGREALEGGNIRIHIADSHCCTAETNTTLKSNSILIKLIDNNF